MPENKVVNPNTYRKNVYAECVITAPSGASFKIKKLSPIELVTNGIQDLPNPFLDFVATPSPEKLAEVLEDKETKDTFEKFLKIVIEKGIIEPKVEILYDKTKIDTVLFWSEISDEDQIFLLSNIVGAQAKNV